MKDVLEYKEFIGSVHFNAEDECFFGRIEGIDDLATFEGLDGDALGLFRQLGLELLPKAAGK